MYEIWRLQVPRLAMSFDYFNGIYTATTELENNDLRQLEDMILTERLSVIKCLPKSQFSLSKPGCPL